MTFTVPSADIKAPVTVCAKPIAANKDTLKQRPEEVNPSDQKKPRVKVDFIWRTRAPQ